MTDKERLEHIEQRLESMEGMLKELIKLAHLNWMYRSEEQKEAVCKEMEERYKDPAFFSGSGYATRYAGKLPQQTKLSAQEEAPDLGDVWQVGASGEDPYAGFYETKDAKKPKVKKGEIKAARVPQKVIGEAKKTRKRKPR